MVSGGHSALGPFIYDQRLTLLICGDRKGGLAWYPSHCFPIFTVSCNFFMPCFLDTESRDSLAFSHESLCLTPPSISNAHLLSPENATLVSASMLVKP